MTSIGDRIKRLRESKNLTQKELGKLIGVSDVSVLHWEKNTNVPKLDKLVKLEEVLNTSVAYIMYGDAREGAGNQVNSKRVVYGAAARTSRLADTGGLDELIEKFIKMDSEGRLTEDFIKSIDSLINVVEKAQETKDQVANGTAPDTKSA